MQCTKPHLTFCFPPFLARCYPESVVWVNGRHRRRLRQGNQDRALGLRDGEEREMTDGNLVPLWLWLLLGGLDIRTQPKEGRKEKQDPRTVLYSIHDTECEGGLELAAYLSLPTLSKTTCHF